MIKKLEHYYNKYRKIILVSISIFILFVLFFFWYCKYKEIQELRIIEEQRLEAQRKLQEAELQKEQEARKKIEYINNLDLETDSSLTKFVSAKVSFDDKWYIPEDLVSLNWDYIIDWKWWSQVLRKEVVYALDKMSQDFYKEFWKSIVIVSAYRSYLYQKAIKDRGCPDNLCAKAWYSEHQSWLAFDVWEATTNQQFLSQPKLKKYFEWLSSNAHKYGFHNSYQKWLDIDTYEIEPWHWRYIWVELATYLKERDITFAEYYEEKNTKLSR